MAPSATAAASARAGDVTGSWRRSATPPRRCGAGAKAHAEYVASRGARHVPVRQTEPEEIDALAGKVDRAIRARRPAVGQKAGRGVT